MERLETSKSKQTHVTRKESQPMASPHLSNEEFLTRLTALLSTTHTSTHGSVFLVQKSFSPSSSETNSTTPTAPKILVRATNGKSKARRQKGQKQKLSTVVEATEIAAFYARYADVCKRGMEGLRKRDKKKAKQKKKKMAKGKEKAV